MSNYYASQQPQYPPSGAPAPTAAQNLQFFPSQYTNTASSGTPQGGYGYANTGGYGVGAPAQQNNFATPGFGAAQQGVSGRMGEQGGLRTGWVAAFSSEGYDGEPPLLEELGVNFGHIQAKVTTLPVAILDRY